MATTQQLEFTQAMQDFKTMFPGMEDGIIEAVLRSNQGAVDATIDQLLAMNTDYENETLRHQMDRDDSPDVVRSAESSASASAAGGAFSGSTRGAALSASDGDSGGVFVVKDRSLSLRDLHGWDPPLVGDLPDDFLRLRPLRYARETMLQHRNWICEKYEENRVFRGVLGGTKDPDLDQFLEDERIALFLQNEEFVAELRRNKDFLSALVKEQGELPHQPDELPHKSVYKATIHDDDVFRERLRNMGKVSRKKFAQLARMFTGRKKRTAKQILGQGSAPSKDSLLLNSEPLLVDTEEDTDDVPAADRHRE